MEIANKTILVIFGSKVLVNSFGIYSRLACPIARHAVFTR